MEDILRSLDKKEPVKREIGSQAVWSLSSCKVGFGIENLRDDNTDTYWQSDGMQPHHVNIQFARKTAVREIAIFTDLKLDESYTPRKIAVFAGTTFHDLQEIAVKELEEPHGWISIPLMREDKSPLRTHILQVVIVSNHQNGRDTHLRQLKVYGLDTAWDNTSLFVFNSQQFLVCSSIR